MLRAYSAYHAGRVVDCEDATARLLIADGTAERADGVVIETAAVEPDVEQADATPRKMKRALPKPENSQPPGS